MATYGTYTYGLVKRNLNGKVHGRLSELNRGGDTGDTNLERDLVNSAVRTAMSDVDFRGAIREVTLTPNLMDNQFDYAIPSDVVGDRIVDFRPQITDSRGFYETYDLVSPEEFDRRKKHEKGIYTIVNDDLDRYFRISADVEDETLVIAELDGVNEADTWRGFANTSDSDVKTEGDDYIQGTGSVRFADTVAQAGDSRVGIENGGLDAFDISEYLSHGDFFVYGKLDTGDTGIKALKLRLGSDSDAFYEFSDSTQNDCTPFQTGWNQVRLASSTRAATGSPTDTAIAYAALFWERDSGTHLDTAFAFDYLIAKKGKRYELSYYSRFLWQDTAFTRVENSTHDSHSLMVQNDEVELILAKAAELASAYLRDREDQGYFRDEYERLKQSYLDRNPSQAGVLTTTRYNFASNEGLPSDTNFDS